MRHHIARRLLLQAALLAPLAGPAMALQDTGTDSWSWRVAPYLWAAGIDGSLTAGPVEVDFDVEFSDIWDNLESAGLILVEAKRGPISILGDAVYLGLDLDGETPGGADVDAEVDTTILELAGLYRLSPSSPFEVGLGMRYADLETDLDLGPASADSDRNSFDGFAAGRATWPFAERWSVSLYGDVGAGDSDLTWQASAMLGLQFTNWGLGLGYRALGYDFEEGSDELDLTMEGLMLGAEFRF